MIAAMSAIAVIEHERVPDLARERGLVERDDVERPGAGRPLHDEERHDHAADQADVAGAGGEERLEGRVGVGLLLPPVADEHEGAQPDELPSDEQLERVVGDDEQQHRRGEEADSAAKKYV